MPGNARAPRAADTVHIVFGDIGQFVVDDVREPFNVKATSSNVGCHQHTNGLVFEAGKRFGACRLTLVAVNGGSDDAVFFKLGSQTIGRVFHAGKDKYLIPLIVHDQVAQQLAFAFLGDAPGFLRNQRAFLVLGNFDRDGIVEVGVGELTNSALNVAENIRV